MNKNSKALFEKIGRAKISALEYTFCHYRKFNYDILKDISYIISHKNNEYVSYNNIIIMADTETSKSQPDESYIERGKKKYKTYQNHVVAWTISLRAYDKNIATLYGRKPSSMVKCLYKIHSTMRGVKTVVYFHNFAYDHVFLRKFAFDLYDLPTYQLNTKPYYPIMIEYSNGLIFKDSLILAQRSLEKWADDLDVEHKKAVGLWDYDKLRDQDTVLSKDEFEYIEHDTLAGVECIDKTLTALNKNISNLPLTATGIPREQTRKRGGRKAHDIFLKIAPDYEQYLKLIQIYHGGFTHGNRHFVDTLINWDTITARDFASSYPFVMLSERYPCENFTSCPNKTVDEILVLKDTHAFMFKFVAINIRLKSDNYPMPALQHSKTLKTINPIIDNGRILCANYVSIYLNEMDLAVINDMYTWDRAICTECEKALKDYLPRWFTDYVYECYTEKCALKNGDPVLYSIAKARVNSLYGLTVQKSLQDDIIEDYKIGNYEIKSIEDPQGAYKKYLNKRSSILPYFYGVWVTSYAFYNIHQLIKCCDLPLYVDTDSCYGLRWDEDKVKAYNDSCKEKLQLNGYGAVEINGREFWLGVAEIDGVYSEFKFMGAKRYACRDKETGKLKITVAGVPKKLGALCLEDDINKFSPGFIFSGLKTNKRTHIYINKEKIETDKHGNEVGDSISLIPCDYELASIDIYDWESLFNEEVNLDDIYDLD